MASSLPERSHNWMLPNGTGEADRFDYWGAFALSEALSDLCWSFIAFASSFWAFASCF